MQPIVEMKFGSHLYGTSTPASDLDIKAVHLPAARDLLLQRVRPIITDNTKTDGAARNSADDVDRESFTLQKFLALVTEGQTVALDMLLAPDWALRGDPSPIWREIQANRSRLLTSRYASFVGYCRTQANKYGIRGSRVAAARVALTILSGGVDRLGTTAKLREIEAEVRAATLATEHMDLIEIPQESGVPLTHWEVCNRKMPFTSSIKSARDIVERIIAEYGHRALQAEQNQNVDWKALSHAVRIAHQSIELLDTGHVTFPRPDAARLLEIKTGALPYQLVAEEIDALLPEIERRALASSLPPIADLAWVDDLVARAHRAVICPNPLPTAGI